MSTGRVGRVVCSECRRELPADRVVARVEQRDELVPATYGPAVVPCTGPVAPGALPPMHRFVPGGTSMVRRARYISWLADGTSRRYGAAVHPDWSAGEHVCLGCRDARVAPSVHGRGG